MSKRNYLKILKVSEMYMIQACMGLLGTCPGRAASGPPPLQVLAGMRFKVGRRVFLGELKKV